MATLATYPTPEGYVFDRWRVIAAPDVLGMATWHVQVFGRDRGYSGMIATLTVFPPSPEVIGECMGAEPEKWALIQSAKTA